MKIVINTQIFTPADQARIESYFSSQQSAFLSKRSIYPVLLSFEKPIVDKTEGSITFRVNDTTSILDLLGL